jgi:hypothetical protein
LVTQTLGEGDELHKLVLGESTPKLISPGRGMAYGLRMSTDASQVFLTGYDGGWTLRAVATKNGDETDLAPTGPYPAGLAAAPDALYWGEEVDNDESRLAMFPLPDGQVAGLPPGPRIGDVAVDDVHVYWSSGDHVFRARRGEEASSIEPFVKATAPSFLAVDAENVYFADAVTKEIRLKPKADTSVDDGTPLVVSGQAPIWIGVMGVAVFWISGDGVFNVLHRIYRCPGEKPVDIVGWISGRAVTLGADAVYLFSSPKGGDTSEATIQRVAP